MLKRLGFLLSLLLLAGCLSPGLNNNMTDPSVHQTSPVEETVEPQPQSPGRLLNDDMEPAATESLTQIELEEIAPNELGKVMVLMYHEVGNSESTWSRHKDNFRRDMETLYHAGYRPVSLSDFLSGRISLPAGLTPFVLTFDDGTAGQFRILEEDGRHFPDPQCAVGILLSMNNEYADFPLRGTFFINYPYPFRQKELVAMKLEILVTLGFEIGNHTFGHENLAKVTGNTVVETLAKHIRSTRLYLPDYTVNTLALPYGALPRDDSPLLSGQWEDITYKHEAILLVGANPAYSPFDQRFNPYRLPRVRADETELYRWLEYFRKNPHQRFISDGDPGTITVPHNLQEYLDSERISGYKIRTY